MKRWEIIKQLTGNSEELTKEDVVKILLENRDLKSEKDIDTFLHPKLTDVTTKSVGIDTKEVKKTIQRIKKAIEKKEQIIVFGDYDVDGITGTAILWETLYGLGANVMPYIPHRVDEGYGLSVKGIENVILNLFQDPKKMPKPVRHDSKGLIITVDNGIVANEAVAFANAQGIDVIITDHHTPPAPIGSGPAGGGGKVPDAYAIVHTTKLCGAGVAWLLSQEIKASVIPNSFRDLDSKQRKILNQATEGEPRFQRVQNDIKEEDTHLELVALATVADLVPLTGANRTLVKYGLKKLCMTQREGLLALYDEAGCEKESIGVYQIGHVIAPRLNASGRLTSAMDSLRLICTKDKNRARVLARQLGSTNKERQLVMQRAVEHATSRIKNQESRIKKLLFVAHESYPEGVIGLVAGRLVEEYYRPSIVIARGEKYSKGSVRSVSGFNMIEFLRSVSDFFINVGGHPMAAGFTVETAKIELLQKKLEELSETLLDDVMLTRSLRIDCVLPLSSISKNFYTSLQQLSPFGMGNPEPTFVSNSVTVKDVRLIGKDKKHLKMAMSQNGGQAFDAIAFGFGDRKDELKNGANIDVVYTVDENTWNGNTKLQLKIKDIRLIR